MTKPLATPAPTIADDIEIITDAMYALDDPEDWTLGRTIQPDDTTYIMTCSPVRISRIVNRLRVLELESKAQDDEAVVDQLRDYRELRDAIASIHRYIPVMLSGPRASSTATCAECGTAWPCGTFAALNRVYPTPPTSGLPPF